jgi:hypothetical protein
LGEYAHIERSRLALASHSPEAFGGIDAMDRVLLEDVAVVQPLEKFPAVHGTWRFVTMFTTAPHCPEF